MDIITPPKKNLILDATLLSSLMACPRMTDLRFNHNLIPISGKSNSLEVGSLVHVVLETFYKMIIQGMRRDQAIGFAMSNGELYVTGCKYCTDFTPDHYSTDGEDPHQCGDKCVLKPLCGHTPNEFPGLRNTPPENSVKPSLVGWKWALQTCEEYFEFYKNDFWVPLEVEVVKGKVLYEDDEIRVLWKSKIDLSADTNQGIFPIDHKTMKQNRDTTSLNNQFIGQCLTMDTRAMFVNKVGFQKTLGPSEKFKRVMIPYSADRLMEWQSEILPHYAYQLLNYTESGYFPPNFNNCENKYGNCIFRSSSEADRSMREEELKFHFMVGPEWNPKNPEED